MATTTYKVIRMNPEESVTKTFTAKAAALKWAKHGPGVFFVRVYKNNKLIAERRLYMNHLDWVKE